MFDPVVAGPSISTVFYTDIDSNGCSVTDTVMANVWTPLAAPVITQSGDTLWSSYTGTNQWYDSTGAITGAQNQFYVPMASGNYYVIAYDSNGCESDTSSLYNFIITQSAVEIGIKYDLNTYPVPAGQWLVIESVSPGVEIDYWELVDLSGRIILANISDQPETRVMIDVSEIDNGVYFLKVRANGNQYLEKVVIQH